MGGAQSFPKITAQDRAILEYASHHCTLRRSQMIDSYSQVSKSSATSLNSIRIRWAPIPFYQPNEGKEHPAAYLPSIPPLLQIQVILEREHEIAKQHLAAGHKDRALVALRRRKYQQGLLVKTDGQLEALEQLARTPAICFSSFTNPKFLPRSRQLSFHSLKCQCYMASNRVMRF